MGNLKLKYFDEKAPKEKIYFSKVNPKAIIPSKREEDGAYDIYACLTKAEYILINPFTSVLVPTGIASAFSPDYTFIFRERGSTGIKNLKINAGVIDSGFRSEWFVLLYNANQTPIVISQNPEIYGFGDDVIIYPPTKAIAQALFVPVPKTEIVEITYEELQNFKSERGIGSLGSSGK
jgi:dUTP pyrophosphatase